MPKKKLISKKDGFEFYENKIMDILLYFLPMKRLDYTRQFMIIKKVWLLSMLF